MKTFLTRKGAKNGSSVALIILLVVLLVFFGVLSLTAAASNIRLATKRADWNRRYYLADLEAERLVADLDGLLQDHPVGGRDSDSLLAALDEQLTARPQVLNHAVTTASAGLEIRALVAASPQDNQGLAVVLVEQETAGSTHSHLAVVGWTWWSPPFVYDSYWAYEEEGWIDEADF